MLKIAAILSNSEEIIKFVPIFHTAKAKGHKITTIHAKDELNNNAIKVTFEMFDLPDPDFEISIAKESPAVQLGKLIVEIQTILAKVKPHIVLIVGNSICSLAAALAASKDMITIAHMDAGLRSFDLNIQEEINSKVIDSISNILFAPTINAITNLHYEGIAPERVFLTGSTVWEILEDSKYQVNVESNNLFPMNNLDRYILVMITNRTNIANEERLKNIIEALILTKEYQIVFVASAYLDRILNTTGLKKEIAKNIRIRVVSALPYFDFLKLITNTKCELVVTDSAYIQEFAAFVGKKCLTIRNSTERPETVEYGLNKLVTAEVEKIKENISISLREQFHPIRAKIPEIYGIKKAAERIVKVFEEHKDLYTFKSPQFFETGTQTYFLLFVKETMTKEHIENNFNCKITAVYDEVGVPIPIPKVLNPGYRCRVVTGK